MVHDGSTVSEAHVLPMIDLFRPAKRLDIYIAPVGPSNVPHSDDLSYNYP